MGIRIESGTQIPKDRPRKYLFFGDQLELGRDIEPHVEILKGSGRHAEEVLVAGRFWFFNDIISVDGEGSDGLNIEKRDPSDVVNFVKKLPELDRGVQVEEDN